jgi:hypothetical protein
MFELNALKIFLIIAQFIFHQQNYDRIERFHRRDLRILLFFVTEFEFSKYLLNS